MAVQAESDRQISVLQYLCAVSNRLLNGGGDEYDDPLNPVVPEPKISSQCNLAPDHDLWYDRNTRIVMASLWKRFSFGQAYPWLLILPISGISSGGWGIARRWLPFKSCFHSQSWVFRGLFYIFIQSSAFSHGRK